MDQQWQIITKLVLNTQQKLIPRKGSREKDEMDRPFYKSQQPESGKLRSEKIDCERMRDGVLIM